MVRLVRLALALLGALAFGGAGRAEGRLTLSADETAAVGSHLLVEVEGRALEDMPDLTPLFAEAEDAGITSGTRLAVISGSLVELRSWRINLLPRRAGMLQLGPLRAGDVESNAISVTVRPRADWHPADGALVLSAGLDPPSPYAGQPVILDVELRHAVPIDGLALQPPAVAGLRPTPLQEAATRRVGDGWITAGRWLLTPAASGALTLPPARAQGVAVGPNGERARIDVATPARSLAVRPWPAGAPQPWLPARTVTLTEAWSTEPSQLRAGEATLRTIVLEAEGVEAADLPAPAFAPTRGLAIVPHAEERETRYGPAGPSARLVRRFDVRALSPSPIFLDTIRLRWWDVAADRPREAVLPARRFDVAPPDGERLRDIAVEDGSPGWLRAVALVGALLAGALLAGALAVSMVVLVLRRTRRGAGLPAGLSTSEPAGFYAALLALPRAQRERPAVRAAMARLEAALYAGRACAPPDLRSLRRTILSEAVPPPRRGPALPDL